MPHALLQFLVDPRVWFGFGIVFFGGFVLAGETSHHRESKRKPPPRDASVDDDDAKP